MSWARLDDRFHGNAKVMQAWHSHPAAVGLYVLGITYCAQHETDGLVHEWFVASLVPLKRERAKLTSCLEGARLWARVDGGWSIPDFLEYNHSKADLEAKRQRERDRGRRARSAQLDGSLTATCAQPDGSLLGPDPTRPVTTPPSPPKGGSRRRRSVMGISHDPSRVLTDIERASYARLGVELPVGATVADAESAGAA